MQNLLVWLLLVISLANAAAAAFLPTDGPAAKNHPNAKRTRFVGSTSHWTPAAPPTSSSSGEQQQLCSSCSSTWDNDDTDGGGRPAHPHPTPRSVNKNEAREREIFKRWDKNSDGRLSLDELQAALDEANVPTTQRQVEAFFRLMLANKGGAADEYNDTLLEHGDISLDDFLAFVAQRGEALHNIHPPDASTFDTWFFNSFSDAERQTGDERFQKATAARKLLCGAAAGIVSRSLTAPVDRIRLLMMTSATPLGMGAAYRTAVAQPAGVRALWMGNGVNCVKIAPEMALKLYSFDVFKSALANNEDDDPSHVSRRVRFVAGGCAGALSECFIYPIDVLLTRMAT